MKKLSKDARIFSFIYRIRSLYDGCKNTPITTCDADTPLSPPPPPLTTTTSNINSESLAKII